jgi:predicted dienelactone hydrolase
MKIYLPTCLLLSALLGGCGEDAPLPPAKPLGGDKAAIGTLHGARAGPHRVEIVDNLVLSGSEGERELTLNLYYPAKGSNYPLLVFSHGYGSNKDSYDRLLLHWSSHGYAILAADHMDCCSLVKGIFNSVRYGQFGLIEARVKDIQRLLQTLPELESLHPAFKGKANTDKLAITGHSFGAFSAQQLGGAAALGPDEEGYQSRLDPSVKAIVAISPPGPMFDTITRDSWRGLTTPTLVTTGTWDIEPNFWPDWRDHLLSYETAVPGSKYALVVEGADHYLGNLICRLEREVEPQEDALTMVKIATTTFLDAYVQDDQAALAFLLSGKLAQLTGDFARISSR